MKKAQGVTWKRAGGPPCENDLAGTLYEVMLVIEDAGTKITITESHRLGKKGEN